MHPPPKRTKKDQKDAVCPPTGTLKTDASHRCPVPLRDLNSRSFLSIPTKLVLADTSDYANRDGVTAKEVRACRNPHIVVVFFSLPIFFSFAAAVSPPGLMLERCDSGGALPGVHNVPVYRSSSRPP